MDRNEVIKIRDTLKCGCNLPVRVLIDNVFTIIDESKPTQFTIWDDDNEVLYSYRLVDPQTETCPSNKGQAVSLFAVSYTSIQAIELPVLPMVHLEQSIENIKNNGKNISDDFKQRIINTYKDVLNPNISELSHSTINNLTGSNLDTDDDYYNGKFKESFQETKRYRELNKLADDEKNKKQ